MKRWAAILIILSALQWLFPKWNGLFFSLTQDMTTGDGRIIAAIFFVGGLLLWYLKGEKK